MLASGCSKGTCSKYIQNWTHFSTNPVTPSATNTNQTRILEVILDFVLSFSLHIRFGTEILLFLFLQ